MANRRQHTIPQFYLKQFLSHGWVYRLGTNAPRSTRNPRDVAVRRDYYGQEQKGWPYLDKLNSLVESEGAYVFKKLVDEPQNVTQGDLKILSYLLANFAVTTPAVIEETRAAELEMAS